MAKGKSSKSRRGERPLPGETPAPEVTPSTPPPGPGTDERARDAKLPEGPFQLLLELIGRLNRWRVPAIIVILVVVGCFAVFAVLPDTVKVQLLRMVLRDESRYIEGTSYVGVAVDNNVQLIDLREWTPRRSSTDERCCKVTWDYRATMRRLLDDVTHFSHRVATTGITPLFTSETHPVVYSIDERSRTAGPTMTRYDVRLDIAGTQLDEPFDLHLRTVRYGAFSDPNTEWAATAIVNATRRIEVRVLFPESKPASNLRFSVSARINNRNYVPLEVAELDRRFDGRELVWTIEHPEVGYAYRVDWDW